jgi:thioredoxin reductase (NADPH)
MESAIPFLVYLIPMSLVWTWYAHTRWRRHEKSLAVWGASKSSGLDQPPSLHPWIDPGLCLGCGSCVDACPEGEILGLVHGKALLIEPSSCIGHGACKEACPQDAIQLVLGTETRGVEIPVVGPDFQSKVPGIFVAGELGGMGLIRNAVVQGREAMEAIACLPGMGSGAGLDVLVVGAGPAGFAASLSAKERGLSCITLEQESFGGTVSHYPRGKIVMTQPLELPLFGKVKLRETTKEHLLGLWREVKEKTSLEIQFKERVMSIVPEQGGFCIKTDKSKYRARAVLLALGRRGTPRKLGVPGEENAKVVYRLVDPAQYLGKRVLVVGGGDSAIEAALSLVEEGNGEVLLSYRGAAFSRVKPKNRDRLAAAERSGMLQVMLSSNVLEIAERVVSIELNGAEKEFANDAVIMCAGGILPTDFLRQTGMAVETCYGEP